MKFTDGCLKLLLVTLLFQCASSTDLTRPDIHVHLQEDATLSPANQQLVSVECGAVQGGNSHLEPQGGQYYLQLNGSLLEFYSAELSNYTNLIHNNGNLTARFSIPKQEWFTGEFTCGYHDFSELVNNTYDLAFVYRPIPSTNSDSAHVFMVLSITFISLFLLTLVTLIILGACDLRNKLMQNHQPHSKSGNHLWNYNGATEEMISRSPMLSPASSSTYLTPFTHPTASAASTYSCWPEQQLHHHHILPESSPAYSKVDIANSKTVNELVAYLDHTTPCQRENCPCFLYKQKVKESLFWSTATQKPPTVVITTSPPPLPQGPEKEVGKTQTSSCSPYHVTGCSISRNMALIGADSSSGGGPGREDSSCIGIHIPEQADNTLDGHNITYPCIDHDNTLSATTSTGYKDEDFSVKFVDPTETITFDSRGGRYRNENHEVCLEIPEGAIPQGKTISIEVGVSLHSSLVRLLPHGKRPVSPIVQFCVVREEKFRFLKPVEITLPHFLDVRDEKDTEDMELEFMKCGHNLYCFHQCDGTASFRPGANVATLKTEHFCMFCIMAKDNISPEKINYRLIKAIPKNCCTEQRWTASFCITYYLRTCLQTLKNQYPDTDYELKTLRPFKFAESQSLEIHFERKLAGGWHLALENNDKITPEDVAYWNKDPEVLKMMEEENVYPPRFLVKVSGTLARETVNALICFRGIADGDDSTELLLESDNVMMPTYWRPKFPPHISPRSINSKLQRGKDTPSHKDLMNYVAAELPTQWQAVGIQLGLSIPKIKDIERSNHNDSNRCFSAVFWEWENQRTAPYTWETMLNVLRSDSVRENRVAERITSLLRADLDAISVQNLRADHDTISISSTGSSSSGYNTDYSVDV